MMKPIIELNNVTFRYPRQTVNALNEVSFSIMKGSWTAIVGHNGSGKSTIARLLNGLQFPLKGELLIDSLVSNETTVWDIRKKIGMVFQHPDNQFVGTTVEDDVAFGLENNGVPREEMIARVQEALHQVRMTDFLRQEPHHLSGGQKQRVAIASVLALQPDVIILDEATSMLDPIGREEVIQTIQQVQKNSGMTVISITHDLEEATQADTIIMMNKGEVYKIGTPREVLTNEVELKKLGLDVPFSLKLQKAFAEKGWQLDKPALTREELVDALWTLG
ncbi:energy-coupling factor ABC transporter ATP-binding protein [Mangrovibacillus cuniculi]|uniref:Energy-coupling factor ABC transporter ATP-binding protein n=1 Tax=Mangrovibacillus cuniculi TaxID=2593652 RepID=A0A7S8CDN9_9BACI|nr:energy-coupling factor ABC transporter ATP-binding protein [Mangrovibacillus cuniculi]QPC48063.1 energy-coupling factor ABC transporter ATP-binding protein [Mangrovibacillus cuniculi]